jgi:hypothetical protein
LGLRPAIPNLPKHDIRLGDIAVSILQDSHASVIQYDLDDLGKYEREVVVLTGCLNKHPPIVVNADSLASKELKEESPLETCLSKITRTF